MSRMTESTRASVTLSSTREALVHAAGLTKVFRDFWYRPRARAVDGVTFDINRGEIFGLLGPNGSGKSTTIKLILGLLKKDGGRLSVFGKPPTDVSIKNRIGYLPEESYLYPFLNARETLDYYAKLFQLDRSVRSRRVDELLEMVGLSAVQFRQVREYSKGMQRRIGIAQALINDPELLILDEPTTGLDPIGTRQIKDLILALGRRGKTIVLCSHLLGDVEDCVDRMVIMYGGKIRAEGTCDSLLASSTRTLIETETLDADTLREVREVLSRRSRAVARVDRPRQRLEDLFVGIVERAQADKVATSGAQHGGATASFLLGSAEGATGDELIDRLMRAPGGSPAPESAAQAPADSEAPQGADDQVIESLLETYRDQAPDGSGAGAGGGAASGAGSVPGAGGDVDRSLIDSLLGKPRGDDADKPRGGQP